MPTTVALNAVDYGFTPGASNPTAALNSAIQAAISAGKPLFVPPGTYTVGQALIDGAVEIYGVPNQVVFQMENGAGNVLYVTAAGKVTIRGINLDGQNGTFGSGWTNPGLLYVSRDQVANTLINVIDCEMFNSTQMGISLSGVGGLISGCEIHDCYYAPIFSIDAETLVIENNIVHDCSNNGILVWRSERGYDGTIVRSNHIFGIGAAEGGSGQYGNGVNTFRADRVVVANNVIRDCEYLAVRSNVSSGIQMIGNNCQNIREVALYFEHTGGQEPANAHAAVIADNIVEDCAQGMDITNFNNGGRLVSCVGNIIKNCRIRPNAPDPRGIGISAEADTVLSANVVEDAEVFGIVLGTGDYTRNLIATGNIIQNPGTAVTTQGGLAVSGTSGAGKQLVTGNLVEMKSGQGVDYALVALDYSGQIIMSGGSPEPVNSTNFPSVTVGTNTLYAA